MMKRLNKGFTLTELLIVLAILAILIVIVIGIINPIGLVGRANDAERKRDLDMIKKTFEEYYNDHGHYPCPGDFDWNTEENCGKNLSQFEYLQPWPCDPFGSPYYISISSNCKSYRIMANLEYTADKAIPDGWYDEDNEMHRVEGYSPEDYNYGVSSADQDWDDYSLDDKCDFGFGCHMRRNIGGSFSCDGVTGCKRNPEEGKTCHVGCMECSIEEGGNCASLCEVECCGDGCN